MRPKARVMTKHGGPAGMVGGDTKHRHKLYHARKTWVKTLVSGCELVFFFYLAGVQDSMIISGTKHVLCNLLAPVPAIHSA